MNTKRKYALAGLLGLLAVLFTVLVRTVDRAAIGPADTSVGFARLNHAMAETIGTNGVWYAVTEWLGILALLVAGGFAVLGLVQWLTRKCLKKVDRPILALGGLYAATIVLYVFFEKIAINCRPILTEGSQHPEASFPSSHTVMVCVIMGSAAIVLRRYVKKVSLLRAIEAGCLLVTVVTVVGRLLSGAHWLTDILGGLLYAAALLAAFSAAAETPENDSESKPEPGPAADPEE